MRWIRKSGRLSLTVPVAFAVATLGCFEFDAPLGPPTTPIDKRLIGHWRCLGQDEDEADARALPLHIRALNETRYALSHPTDKGENQYRAHLTKLRDDLILNVNQLKDGEPSKGWHLLRLSFLRPRVLLFELADDDAFEDVAPTSEALREAFEKRSSQPKVYSDLLVCVTSLPSD